MLYKLICGRLIIACYNCLGISSPLYKPLVSTNIKLGRITKGIVGIILLKMPQKKSISKKMFFKFHKIILI